MVPACLTLADSANPATHLTSAGSSKRVKTRTHPLIEEQLYVPPHVCKNILRDILRGQGLELNVSSNQGIEPLTMTTVDFLIMHTLGKVKFLCIIRNMHYEKAFWLR
jgi:hypothetical protein